MPSGDMIALPRNTLVDSILKRYPTFITRPFEKLLQPASLSTHFEQFKKTLETVVAYLNFTFLLTYLFYTPRNPKVDAAVMESLKANLCGPYGVRNIHQFSLIIKSVKGNDSFFPFPLSRAMSEGTDQNPLMSIKDLWEFVRAPQDELVESLPGAFSVFCEALISLKVMLQNKLIQRNPPGAREALVDLSGPTPGPLAADSRPSLDIPAGEIIVLSKDRSEALGLFPFFVFNGKEVVYTIPDQEQFKTLLERLELH
jgi:hypothetical protein